MKTDTKTKTVHPGKLGNLNAVKAGDSSVLLVGRVAKRIAREYLPELEDLFPWLSDTDRPALELLAGDIAKLRLSEGYLARKGEHDAEGKIRPQAHRADKLRERIFAKLEKLGGTPSSRAALGLDVARGRYYGDLATRASRIRNGNDDH